MTCQPPPSVYQTRRPSSVDLQKGPSVVSGLRTHEFIPAKTSLGSVDASKSLSDLWDFPKEEVCRAARDCQLSLPTGYFDHCHRSYYLPGLEVTTAPSTSGLGSRAFEPHAHENRWQRACPRSDLDCSCAYRETDGVQPSRGYGHGLAHVLRPDLPPGGEL